MDGSHHLGHQLLDTGLPLMENPWITWGKFFWSECLVPMLIGFGLVHLLEMWGCF